MKRWCMCVGMTLLVMLVACQPQADDVLPTVIDLNGTLTQEAAATAAAATPLPPTLPPLPATWTPSPVPSGDTQSQAVLSSPTPEAMGQGFIYYIFNGDSI
ncbi:MAG: hypothetical protein K8I60_06110, partial [Anaerolineae bacterium]|nr:hypothetical protein [Anaerolineae bacterium]